MDQTKMISFNSTGLESNIIVQNVFIACVYYENYIYRQRIRFVQIVRLYAYVTDV